MLNQQNKNGSDTYHPIFTFGMVVKDRSEPLQIWTTFGY